MRETKDSGVEWIDTIPEDWFVVPLKTEVSFGKGLPITKENLIEKGVAVVSYGQIHSKMNTGSHLKEELIRYVSEDYLQKNPECLAQKGDIFVADTSEDYDGVGNAVLIDWDGDVFAGYHTVIIRPRNKQYSKYLSYLFMTDAWRSQLRSRASGIKVYSVTQGLLKKTEIIIPNSVYVQRLTDYLDRKCSAIDNIITKQEQIIEKLKEYKLALITETVTKGLNSDVELIESGIEWIGKIPITWSIGKLSLLFDFVGGYAFNSDDYISETEYQVIRIGNVKNDNMLLDSNPVYVSKDTAEKASRFEIKEGYILFTMTGTKGKRDYFFTCLVDASNLCNKRLFINQRVGAFVHHKDVCAGYYKYLLKETRILDSIFLYETGTANQGNLGIDTIRRTKVQIPPFNEQCRIAKYLDDKCIKLNNEVEQRELIINRLLEYKKALIYEVITGKKEV